jgi:hypothetical protein
VAASAEVVSLACVGTASAVAAGLEIAFDGASGRTGSSALASPVTNSDCGERRSSSARPKSPPASSLHALLLHGRSGVEVSASLDAEAGGGYVIRSMEMGDLRRKHPIIELIRTAVASSGKKHGGERLTRLQW